MTAEGWLVLVESNTTGTGRLFCARARELGLRPLVVARDPGRYPYLAADGVDVRVAETRDHRSVLAAVAGRRNVRGVTSSSESYVGCAAEAAAALGLPAPAAAAIRSCQDKARQRELLAAAGLAMPRFAGADTARSAARAAAEIGFPVVVKPVTGTGSTGVRLCASADEVLSAARALLGGMPRVLVEEYLTGREFSVELFDGKVVGITRTFLGDEPFFVETGHDFPARLPSASREDIADTAVRAVCALGLGWGPVHAELRLSPGGPRIIEVNPRLAGGMIPRLVELAAGTDLIGLTVARAAGMAWPARASTTFGSASIRFLVALAGGRLAGVAPLDAVLRLPGAADAGYLAAPGDPVSVTGSFRDRLGYVICVGPDSGERAARALRELSVRIDPALPDDADLGGLTAATSGTLGEGMS